MVSAWTWEHSGTEAMITCSGSTREEPIRNLPGGRVDGVRSRFPYDSQGRDVLRRIRAEVRPKADLGSAGAGRVPRLECLAVSLGDGA